MGSAATPLYAPSKPTNDDSELPHVDERLARPGVWEEVRDGVVYELTPADEKHGDAHHHVASVVGAIVRDEYKVSIDRLTRTGKRTDFAPDVSIYPREKTADGHSKMAEIAIEVADSQSRADVRWKAEKLVERGCRRVFLVDVTAFVVCEYDHAANDWQELAPDMIIEDPIFLTPVTAMQMIDQVRHDSLVIDAYRVAGSPALREFELSVRTEVEAREHNAGALAEAKRVLRRLLNKRFGVSDDPRIEACASVELLETWAERLLSVATVDDVFCE